MLSKNVFRWMFVWVIKMLPYEKIDISEEIDTNKTSKLKECMFWHYWHFKNIGYKFESNVCNKCHDILITAYEWKNITMVIVKGVDYRCILWGISRNETPNILYNFALEDKGAFYMEFIPNKTPLEMIKEGAFGGTYFRDIYLGANGKWERDLWKEFSELKTIDQKFFVQIIKMLSWINTKLKLEHHKDFGKNKSLIIKIGPYGWFQWYFRYFIVNGIKGKLVRMIKTSFIELGLWINWKRFFTKSTN